MTTMVSNPIGGSVAIVDGHIEFTPTLNFNGQASFTYTVQDNGQTNGVDDFFTDTGTASFTVTAVNDAPTSTNDSVTTAEDTAVVLAIADFGTFADVDGDSLAAVAITTLPSNGALEWKNGADVWVGVTLNQSISSADITTGKLRFLPGQDENGNPYATIGFKVGDGFELSTSAYTLTVGVTAVNDAPVADDDTLSSVAEDSGVRIISFASLLGNDDDGDPEVLQTLSITAVNNAVGGTVAIVGGQIEFTLAANFFGTASFDYTVQDNGQTNSNNDFRTDLGSASFTVTDVAEGPVVAVPYTGLDATYDHDSDVGAPDAGFIVLAGTGGADTIAPSGPGAIDSDTTPNDKDIINGFGGDDIITAGEATDRVYGGSGADTINGGQQADALYGQADNDTINGDENGDDIFGGSGNDILNGNIGSDVIYGGSGNDTIDGGSDDDVIIGGYGADSLTGGDGTDTFTFLSALDTGDTIHGWLTADDTLNFSAIAGITGASATLTESVVANSVTYHQDGGNTVIWADTDNVLSTVELQITLVGVAAANLNAGDFIL